MLLTYKTLLTKKTQLNSNTYLYHFDLIEPKEIIFKPGQYIMLKIPSGEGYVSRLYSIASPNTQKNSFELIIGIIPGGLASNYLFSLKENTEITFQGPAGMFGLRENEREEIFLITGTGIAPVRSMIKSNNKNHKFNLFWGLKNYKDIYLLDELKQFNPKICLSREQNLDMVPNEERKYFELGHVDSCFDKLATSHQSLVTNSDFYLCGGRTAVESLRIFLLSKGVLLENIIFEKF
ncbi:MAG: FAD-dependent oxidoreductase [Patescibacteria group bacterium]|jgi:NAD(P)H-flavin reductase